MSIVASGEVWRIVHSHPQYEVSNFGRVRRGRRQRKLSRHPAGYIVISLFKANRGKVFLVHRLVAELFIGARPAGAEVNHIDGDKTNNRVDNLEYVTRSENIHHAIRTGLMRSIGEQNPMAKLSDDDARTILRLHACGHGYKALGAQYGVSWEAVRNLVKGRSWKHLRRAPSFRVDGQIALFDLDGLNRINS